ncbi:membrane-anchored junction protein-like [Orbicella faveolata]|uniref:membrane-anchored junction protein-like n=1 Tax=Orbicella faveolata TaxID=48498 RepID=UPI0009E1B35D|nr:membrane-anchored junction protein-like [Orbicella faveolata]
MPLKPFTFDRKPDIRLVVYGKTVYKIKVICRKSSDRESIRKLCSEEKNNKDLERVICAILNTYELVPVKTDNFVVYPYKNHWETRDRVLFSQNGQPLDAHRYAFTLYVEVKEAITNHSQNTKTGRVQGKQIDEEAISGGVEERVVTEYGQKNRHDVEEKDLKEFLRLQKLASEDDEQRDDMEDAAGTSGLQKVFNALVSPVRSFLGH